MVTVTNYQCICLSIEPAPWNYNPTTSQVHSSPLISVCITQMVFLQLFFPILIQTLLCLSTMWYQICKLGSRRVTT